MAEKRGYPSVGALVMARAQKQLAEENDDAELALHAIKLERRGIGDDQVAPIGVASGRDMTSSVAALVMARMA